MMKDKRLLTVNNITHHQIPVEPGVTAALRDGGVFRYDTTLQDYRPNDSVLLREVDEALEFTGVETWARVARIGMLDDTNTKASPVQIELGLVA